MGSAALPTLDLAAYRTGAAGEADRLAAQLREALEQVGFFAVVGHGIPWAQVDDIYAQAARYHALPSEEKMKHPLGPRIMGYNPMGGEQNDGRPTALNAAFFLARPGSSRNQWPDEDVLPGFRAACSAYYEAMDRLCHDQLLPLYARALDLPNHWFQRFFDPSLASLRLSHYPPLPAEDDQWGIDAHSDAGFMTLLPANPVAGLWIRPPDHHDARSRPGAAGYQWFEPDQPPESFIVNSGDMLRRWTNDRFLSTVHRVRNESGQDRYGIPFFYDPRVDTVIECLPSCHSADDPPRHEPITYRDYLTAFMGRSYAAVRSPA